jgi:hypothetical protein
MNKAKYHTSIHKHKADMQKPDFTLSWNLMDAVQHVADTQLPLQFDVIDECDIYGGLKTLQLFKHAKVSIGGTVRRLKSYILTGRGTSPILLAERKRVSAFCKFRHGSVCLARWNKQSIKMKPIINPLNKSK